MTLAELLHNYQRDLQHLYEEDEVKAIFSLVTSDLLKYNAAAFILHKHEPLSTENELKFKGILAELASSKPIQYILGNTVFYGLPFIVNPSVLIPRPETEELVDWIISSQRTQTLKTDFATDRENEHPAKLRILDIGTGSGCIAISLKKHLPKANMIAIDISEGAIVTATENASMNEVRVQFKIDDILKPSYNLKQERFDIIVSNPPYIKEDEKPAMHQNVLTNEPHTALFVSNENPLLFYKAIADFALMNLNVDGSLFFEINEYLGEETVKMLKEKGFDYVALRRDMQAKDRMILARLN